MFSIGVYALIIGLLAFLGYFFLKAFKADDAMKTSWTDLSQRMGFDLSYPRLGLPEIEGELEGRRIRIRATPGSGGSDGGPEKTHYYAEHKRSSMSRLKLEHSGQLSFQSDIKIRCSSV